MEDKIIYKNYAYSIQQNEFADQPGTWFDDIFLVYDHRDFCIERKEFYPPEIYAYINGDNDYDFSNFWIFPVYAYIHSNISLCLTHNGDKWYTSMHGYILAHKSEFTEESAEINARNLIDNWNHYLLGDVYNIITYEISECSECGHTSYKEIDDCYGVYGYDEAVKLAKEIIDGY